MKILITGITTITILAGIVIFLGGYTLRVEKGRVMAEQLGYSNYTQRWYEDHINKFKDGDVTCWVYTVNYGGGISCLRDAE